MTPHPDHLDGVGAEELAAPASVRAMPGERRRLLIQGLTWSAIFQVFDVVFSFASMLVLVRIIPPGDYGRVAAVVGVLGFVNLFNANLFYQHALQLPEHDEPDWDLHWTWGFYIQLAQASFCHALAGLCWFVQSYRPIAPLLHIAAFGVLLDWPNSFGATMLRRQLDLRRLRIVAGTGMTVRLVTIVVLALAGFGAYAIVIGNNVVTALPFALDLLFVRGWQPGGAGGAGRRGVTTSASAVRAAAHRFEPHRRESWRARSGAPSRAARIRGDGPHQSRADALRRDARALRWPP